MAALDDDDDADLEVATSHSVTPELLLLQRESEQKVMNALASMPAPYREIVLLCEIEEMSYKEIAQVLAIPIGTVMSRLARARKVLRQGMTAKSSEKAAKWTVIKTPSR
jgi:RNA polymerase sigma-70 factor (ECF subfamily)